MSKKTNAEKYFHSMFKRRKSHTEWFSLTEEDILNVKRIIEINKVGDINEI